MEPSRRANECATLQARATPPTSHAFPSPSCYSPAATTVDDSLILVTHLPAGLAQVTGFGPRQS